ncbi:hypothetical protein EDB92DRAFT_683846 [Lactarius akahatsu]|uniref:Uncharacterized protein n=1 Tax=Lactarius akahatsu TaxID=416441 RepID=A0AAD4LGW1_9AGAM|nr:hypothetical protein EDB92DRAFT_683846 [Lactarius akahatsu]
MYEITLVYAALLYSLSAQFPRYNIQPIISSERVSVIVCTISNHSTSALTWRSPECDVCVYALLDYHSVMGSVGFMCGRHIGRTRPSVKVHPLNGGSDCSCLADIVIGCEVTPVENDDSYRSDRSCWRMWRDRCSYQTGIRVCCFFLTDVRLTCSPIDTSTKESISYPV